MSGCDIAAIATAGHLAPDYQAVALTHFRRPNSPSGWFFIFELFRTRRMMARMTHGDSRKVFLVVAGGNPSAQKHFEDTIQRKRTLQEVRGFLPSQEIENLEKIYHGSNFIVWGAVPGPMNESRWEKMAPGDVVLIYNRGRIRFAGEIAAKVRNKELARYFWNENDAGSTINNGHRSLRRMADASYMESAL